MIPCRIQRKRSRGWKMPPNTIYVGRGTIFGNPHKINEPGVKFCTPADVVRKFRFAVEIELEPAEGTPAYPYARKIVENLHKLRGKNLACFCPLDQPCHADILLEIANR